MRLTRRLLLGAALGGMLTACRLGNDAGAVVWFRMGLGLYRNGMNDSAVAAFSKAIKLAPYYGPAYNFRGLAYRQLGRWDDAERSFRAALTLGVDSALIMNNLGLLFLDQNDTTAGLDALNNALRINPRLAAALTNRGRLRRMRGQWYDALADLNAALLQRPNDPIARNQRGLVFYGLANFDSAVANFQAAVHDSATFKQAFLNPY